MAIKIDRKIVKYQVQKPEEKAPDKVPDKAADKAAEKAAERPPPRPGRRTGGTGAGARQNGIPQGHPHARAVERPEVLVGSTYKIKTRSRITHVRDHQRIVLNEARVRAARPSRFSSTQEPRSLPVDRGAPRIISAVFRKGGRRHLPGGELKAVFDPRGGYWQPAESSCPRSSPSRLMSSRSTCRDGLIRKTQLDPHQQKLVDEKRAEFRRAPGRPRLCQVALPEGAQLVVGVQHAAVVMMDGCMTAELRRLENADDLKPSAKTNLD